MELAQPPVAGAVRDTDLRTLAFDHLVEPTLLLDPHADQIIDANPAACTLLGYDRALLRDLADREVVVDQCAGAFRRERQPQPGPAITRLGEQPAERSA